jgi:hypothetical protein
VIVVAVCDTRQKATTRFPAARFIDDAVAIVVSTVPLIFSPYLSATNTQQVPLPPAE